MDTLLIVPFIETLQSFSSEIVSLILFGVCIIAILSLFRIFGSNGLYLYNIVAILAANIQVLKGAQFWMSHEPVALGTVVFATTYLCSDILTEHYGKEVAKQGVWYCFAAQLLMTLLMIIAVGYPSLSKDIVGSPGSEHMLSTEQAMSLLFTPSARLLFASLLAFAVSQLNDIWVFQRLSKFTDQKWLWFRTAVATLCSAMVDTILFSILAWVVLSPHPVSFSVLLFTYILGTFVTRAIIAILSIPVMYFSYLCSPPLRRLYVS